MNTNKKTKQVKKCRVLVGGTLGYISRDFHELGVIVKIPTNEPAEGLTEVMCNNLIQRTHEARKIVARSLFPQFKAFDPLFYNDGLEAQPYTMEVEA